MVILSLGLVSIAPKQQGTHFAIYFTYRVAGNLPVHEWLYAVAEAMSTTSERENK